MAPGGDEVVSGLTCAPGQRGVEAAELNSVRGDLQESVFCYPMDTWGKIHFVLPKINN